MRVGVGFGLQDVTLAGTTTWAAVGGTLTVSIGTQAASLNAIFQAAGGAWASVFAVPVNSDTSWRFTGRDNDFQYASRLSTTSVHHIPVSGGVFIHDDGIPLSQVHAELVENKAYLESICPGLTVRSHLYPLHDHDRQTMRKLRELGYYACRDGWVSPTFPDGGLLGDDYTTVNEIKTWAYWQRFAMLGHLQFKSEDYTNSGGIGGQNSAWIYNYLYFTGSATYQTTPVATTLYGYHSLMEAWKANNTWVSFNIHYNITSADLNTLISIFQADGDFWIGTLAEIGEWAAARHAPYGAVYNDEFVYEPLSGHTAADYGSRPWNGKRCAITFTNDDGQTETATVYAAVAAGRGIKITAGFLKDAIGDVGYLNAGAVRALHEGGVVEVACHGKSWPHVSEVDERGMRICCTAASSIMGLGITATGSHKTLQLYCATVVSSQAASPPWHAAVSSLVGFRTLHDADSLSLGSVHNTPWAAAIGTLTGSCYAAGTGAIVCAAGPNGHRTVQSSTDEGTSNFGTVFWPDAELSSTSGFTIGVVAKSFSATTGRILLAKMNNAARAWGLTSNLAGITNAGASAWDATANTGFTDTNSFHAVIMTFIPGQPFRIYRDAVNSAYATANSAAAGIADTTVGIRFASRDTGGGTMNAGLSTWLTLDIGYAHAAAELTTIMDALKTYGGIV